MIVEIPALSRERVYLELAPEYLAVLVMVGCGYAALAAWQARILAAELVVAADQLDPPD